MIPFWQMIVWAFSGQISVGSPVVYKYASSSCHRCSEVVLSRGPNLLCSRRQLSSASVLMDSWCGV